MAGGKCFFEVQEEGNALVRLDRRTWEIKFQFIVLNMMLNGIDMYRVDSGREISGLGVGREVMAGG